MYISSLALTNFRCFGSAATQVILQPDLTCLIGNNASGTELVIDAVLEFPELAENAEVASNTVPAFFNLFIVEGTEELPMARIQLRETWRDDGSTEGGGYY